MKNPKIHISVITPVYNSEKCLDELYQRLKIALEKISPNFEIIMVNDGSPGNDWAVIKRIARIDNRVKGINLTRNFGQHCAITAGIDFVKGDWIIIMDCDLQDQPEEIEKLYKKIQEGYDVVFGRRVIRNDGFFRKVSSLMFYKVFEYISGRRHDPAIANFSICKRQVIEKFKELRERSRSYPIIIEWMGFEKGFVDVLQAKRFAGNTSYNLRKLINFSIENIIAFSNKPLKISILTGFTISLLSFLWGIYLIVRFFAYGIIIEGWTSVMVSIYFVAGILLANLGVIGLYIGKIFDETKKRPIYIIKEIT